MVTSVMQRGAVQTHGDVTGGSDDAYLRQTRSVNTHSGGRIQTMQTLKQRRRRREGGRESKTRRSGDRTDSDE